LAYLLLDRLHRRLGGGVRVEDEEPAETAAAAQSR
jgi:hypothetical protein